MKTTLSTSKKKKLLAQESRVGMFFVNSWLIFFALISLVPMAWLLLAPSKTDEQVVNNAALSFGSFKGYWTAWNNLRFFDDGVIQDWVVNSVVFNIAIVIIATATASLAGFVLSASRIRFKRVYLISTLIMMLIPPVALVVPLFVLMDKVGLVDNPLSVILISSLYPFGTFLSYIYYSTTIPPELYESARLDGCTDWQLYSKIAFPLSGALISLLAFFAFIGNWANYFLPYILLYSSENYTLPLGLGFLFNSTPAINPGVGATSVPIYKPEIALAGVLVALPILIVFLLSQRRLVKGMLAGSIKE